MAARGRAGQSARVAGFGGPLQGDRRHAPARALRRRSQAELAERSRPSASDAMPWTRRGIEDDRLRLIFTCCHPALPPDAQVALTLREVCGLTTEEIARAFLDAPPTLAQRIVRAKAKIRDARIPYEVPGPRRAARAAGRGAAGDLPGVQRGLLGVVGRVADPRRPVGRGDPPGPAAGRAAAGARGDRAAGADAAAGVAARGAHLAGGELILLDDQDRSLLGPRADRGGRGAGGARAGLARASARTRCRRRSRRCTPRRPSAAATDWAQIVGLYDVLLRARAVAGGRAEPRRGGRDARRPGGGPGADRRDPRRAAICTTTTWPTRRGRTCAAGSGDGEARASYERALALTRQEPERRFLERRGCGSWRRWSALGFGLWALAGFSRVAFSQQEPRAQSLEPSSSVCRRPSGSSAR